MSVEATVPAVDWQPTACVRCTCNCGIEPLGPDLEGDSHPDERPAT